MPVLLAFIAEDLGFSPSRLVLEDEYVFFRWFRCLTWGGLMEVDRWLLLDQRVKEVSEVSYLFSLLCLFLPLMQRTWECVLIIWAGCRTGTGEVICYLEFAISLYIAFHRVNRQLFPGPLEKCRLKKKRFLKCYQRGRGGSIQFSHSVVSDSLRPHESQHTRPPCPSPTPGVYPNSCPSSRWCHPTISSSVVPFSSCPRLGAG